jgi:hypothetical protein
MGSRPAQQERSNQPAAPPYHAPPEAKRAAPDNARPALTVDLPLKTTATTPAAPTVVVPQAPPPRQRLASSPTLSSERSPRPKAPPVPSLRETLAKLAPRWLEPVRCLVIGMQWTEPVSDLVESSRSAVRSLRAALAEAGCKETSVALDELEAALRDAGVDGDGRMGDAAQTRVLVAFAKMVTDAPALEVEETSRRRETVIVEALLSQIPGMNANTIDKLRACGKARLVVLDHAEDLVNGAGIGSELASRIVERMKRYRLDLRRMPLGDAGPLGWEHLGELLVRLRQAHDRYQEATSSYSDDGTARKRQLRDERNDALLDIKIALARAGELDRLADIERLPFDRKIERLEDYMAEIVSKEKKLGAPRQAETR